MRHGRLIIATALAALAVMATSPAWAAAATSSFVDDSTADFSAGTLGTDTSAVNPGSVRLASALAFEPFDVDPPAGLTPTLWHPLGTATVAGGALTVDGAAETGNQATAPGQVVEFTASFSGAAGQHLGLGSLDHGPWAIFSTNLSNGHLYARTLDDDAGATDQVTEVLPFDSGVHTYRIEWSPTEVRYFVDGVSVATHAVAIAAAMPIVISDLDEDALAQVVRVDSFSQTRFSAVGTFVSAVRDAGDADADWGTLTADLGTPAGTGVTFQTRSGQTSDLSAAPWEPVANDGTIASPNARYIQYRAQLATSDTILTPSVDRVALTYDDSTGPTTTIDDVSVNGTSAAVSFSSPAADLDRFECSLDGAAPAACTSPTQLSGLAAGSHTISVHGVDRLANGGPTVAKTFTVDNPSAGGGGGGTGGGGTGGGVAGGGTTQQSGGGSSSVATPDKTSPKVSFVAKSSRASKRGTVSFKVGCPATETRCRIQVELTSAGKTVAKKTVTVAGGKTATVTLQLSKAARQQLAKHGKLKMSTVVTASDAAGNRKKTTRPLTVRAPSA